MVKNDVSFILSFEILMAKMWIFDFSPRVCPTGPHDLVSFFMCLVSNGRRALLEGIRLDGSATHKLHVFLFSLLKFLTFVYILYSPINSEDHFY